MADGDTSMQSVERTLTDGEVLARKNEHVAIELEIDHLAEERKDAAADFKGRLEPKRTRRKELLRAIETGRESYEVECVESWDYKRNLIEVKRKDTGEVLDEQPMGFEERQETLAGVKGGKNKGKAANAKTEPVYEDDSEDDESEDEDA
jgi:hypothetical protein